MCVCVCRLIYTLSFLKQIITFFFFLNQIQIIFIHSTMLPRAAGRREMHLGMFLRQQTCMSYPGIMTLAQRSEGSVGYPINVYKYLNGGYKEDRTRLFSVMTNDRMRGSGHKVKHRRFCLNTRKHFVTVRVTKHWCRLPSEAVGSPSLGNTKSYLDVVLGMACSRWPCLL